MDKSGDRVALPILAFALLFGICQLGFNALTHGTLDDDMAPYDSQAWMMPFVVTGHEMGDYLMP